MLTELGKVGPNSSEKTRYEAGAGERKAAAPNPGDDSKVEDG